MGLKTFRCVCTSKCCTRDFPNIPFAPSQKLTSLATVPDTCFTFEQELPHVQKKPVFDATTSANMTASPSFEPTAHLSTRKHFFNETISYIPIFEESGHRKEYQKLKRFHFGREAPVAFICMCVAFDCALIALTCAFLNHEELSKNGQEVDVFESFEDIHGRLMREVQTQTMAIQRKKHSDRSVQTLSHFEQPLEERLAPNVQLLHQSDC